MPNATTKQKIIGVATVGVGSWYIFTYTQDLLGIESGTIALLTGIVLIFVGISVFRLKGPAF